MKYDARQFLQIPYDIIEKCLGNPLDALIWAYVFGWENSSKMSKIKLKLNNIAEFFGVNEKTVYASLDRLQAKGLIGKVKTLHGTVISTRKDQIRRFDNSEKRRNKTPKNGVIEPSKTEQYYSEKRSNHNSISSSLNLSCNKTTTTTSSLSSRETLPPPTPPKFSNPYRPRPTQAVAEPFEMTPEPDSRLLNPSMHRVDRTPPMEFQAVEIPEQIRARIQGVLGTDSVARWIRQEHIDSGFINYALDACSSRKVQRPAGLFVSLLRDEYRPGWTSPEETLRRRQEERLAEIEF